MFVDVADLAPEAVIQLSDDDMPPTKPSEHLTQDVGSFDDRRTSSTSKNSRVSVEQQKENIMKEKSSRKTSEKKMPEKLKGWSLAPTST